MSQFISLLLNTLAWDEDGPPVPEADRRILAAYPFGPALSRKEGEIASAASFNGSRRKTICLFSVRFPSAKILLKTPASWFGG